MGESDLDAIAGLLSDPDVMRYYPRPKNREEALGWIRWNQHNYVRDGFGLWILEDSSGAFIGECGLTWQTVDSRTDLEIGYHVLPAWQGNGLATEAAHATRDFARACGIQRLIAVINPENVPSQRVAEKVGMRLEKTGTHDKTGRSMAIYSAAF